MDIVHIGHIASRWLSFPTGQVCSQVWCRPYLAANFGFFEFRMFPWSLSKAEVGTFYPFPLKVSPSTLRLFLKALVWGQVLSRQNREIKWQQDAIGVYTWASLYHSYVRIFLCQARVSAAMLLIVKGWLKWVRRETWSHSGRFLVCKKLKFFIGVPNVSWLTE